MKSMDMVVNKTRIHDLWSLSIEGRVKAGAHIGGQWPAREENGHETL
jgi:hypothetical protein